MAPLVNQTLPQHTTSLSGSGEEEEEEEEEEELGTNMAAPVGAPFPIYHSLLSLLFHWYQQQNVNDGHISQSHWWKSNQVFDFKKD